MVPTRRAAPTTAQARVVFADDALRFRTGRNRTDLQQRRSQIFRHLTAVEPFCVKRRAFKTLRQRVAQKLALTAYNIYTRVLEDVPHRRGHVLKFHGIAFPLQKLRDAGNLPE